MPLAEIQDNPNERLATQIFCDSRHLIKEVTDLAHKRDIVASEDIYASGGMKPVSKGSLTG